MIEPRQLLEYVVRPTLGVLMLGGPAAEQVMMGTAMQESRCGEFLAQVGGPARGVWQMEPATEDDLWVNFLDDLRRYSLALRVKQLMIPGMAVEQQLTCNLAYACAMARVLYFRVTLALPQAGDWAGQAHYYKTFYNTPKGAATEAEYLARLEAIKGLW